MKELDTLELQEINGGHNETAYQAGKVLGDAIKDAATLIGIIAICGLL